MKKKYLKQLLILFLLLSSFQPLLISATENTISDTESSTFDSSFLTESDISETLETSDFESQTSSSGEQIFEESTSDLDSNSDTTPSTEEIEEEDIETIDETSLNKYGTILATQHKIFLDESFEAYVLSKDFIKRTFFVDQVYPHSDGKTYLRLLDKDDHLIGYIDEEFVFIVETQAGRNHEFNKYVTIIGNAPIWNDFDWNLKHEATVYQNQTLKVKDVFYHFDGSKYFSLYDNQDLWVGYIHEDGTKIVNGEQGAFHSTNQYVTLKGDSVIWGNFDWVFRHAPTAYQNQTLQARGIYYHFNGGNYLSLYDQQGKWVGYVNEAGTRAGKGQQGAHSNYGEFVTITGSYAIWGSFAWTNQKSMALYKNQTLEARGIYYHFNGSAYLSLYDNKGKWVGYMNEKGARLGKGRQGAHFNHGESVKVKSPNYTIWRSFSWTTKASGTFTEETYLAKGVYNHFNGSRYLSLYDQNNKWIGYINEAAVHYVQTHLFVMGHGGYDPGAVGNNTNERDFTRNELLPHLRKYANQLKDSYVIFYDTTRDLFRDTNNGNGLYDPQFAHVSSITEIHLDGGPIGATGGHVIVHPNKASYTDDLALASIVKKYNGLWGGVASNQGLSYRKNLLNLNVSQDLGISYRLVELGFIANKKDLTLLRTNRDRLAKEFIETVTKEKL